MCNIIFRYMTVSQNISYFLSVYTGFFRNSTLNYPGHLLRKFNDCTNKLTFTELPKSCVQVTNCENIESYKIDVNFSLLQEYEKKKLLTSVVLVPLLIHIHGYVYVYLQVHVCVYTLTLRNSILSEFVVWALDLDSFSFYALQQYTWMADKRSETYCVFLFCFVFFFNKVNLARNNICRCLHDSFFFFLNILPCFSCDADWTQCFPSPKTEKKTFKFWICFS